MAVNDDLIIHFYVWSPNKITVCHTSASDADFIIYYQSQLLTMLHELSKYVYYL